MYAHWTTRSGTSPRRRRPNGNFIINSVVKDLVDRALNQGHQRITLVDGEREARGDAAVRHDRVRDVRHRVPPRQRYAVEGAALQLDGDAVLQRRVEHGGVEEVPPKREQRHHQTYEDGAVVHQRRMQGLECAHEHVRLRHIRKRGNQAHDDPEDKQYRSLRPDREVVQAEPALGDEANDPVHGQHVVHVHRLRKQAEAEVQHGAVPDVDVVRVGEAQNDQRLEHRQPQGGEQETPKRNGVVHSSALLQAAAPTFGQPVGSQVLDQVAHQLVHGLRAPRVVEDGVASQQSVRHLPIQYHVEHQGEGREEQIDNLLAPCVEHAHAAKAGVEVVDHVHEAETEVSEYAVVEQELVLAKGLAAVHKQ
ncbi:peptide deformylase, putative [Babesia ovata]|uniref:Peptide deformylase, putative n=1 Tax=Babesia ovata TaxID=189622 RepID=A0A2H6K738_9APIC|nr:peptide deformylase, putative [Babesia ovata]GBE58801.1 peptide deformylase, putative [Babesia ovata]